MKGARGNAQDVATTFKANDVERHIPGKIDQIKRATTTGSKQVVFLVRMQIELPSTSFVIIRGTDRGPGMDHKIASIGAGHGHIKKAHRRRIAEAFVGQQFEHELNEEALSIHL